MISTTATPKFLSSGYNGLVSKVVVNNVSGGNLWVMDDVKYLTTDAVPEGSSLLMLACGTLPVGALIRSRRRKKTLLD